MDDIISLDENLDDNLGVTNVVRINSITKIIEYSTMEYLELKSLLNEIEKLNE